ncbi:MAG TPA: 2-dehydropantoate 2-reductase [Dongiaceae bacterium]|nr:2-dehydropantoate 2-reductase [Dongiaceae bacterium]
MRILVLGAGAVGGYFGGRLAAAGADVTFLVRDRRAARLAADGLVIKSPTGDLTLPSPKTLTAGAAADIPFDIVLLTCKAYDLGAAIESIAPHVGAASAVLPLLNGMAHLDALDARFGEARVLGGLCQIAATLTPDGEIRHLNDAHRLVFGERDGRRTARVQALAAVMAGARFESRPSDDILQEMWEKFVMLATLAGMTCLMRASVGAIMAAAEGEALMREFLDECAAVAAAAGHPPRAVFLERTRPLLTARESDFTASMLRDIERGGPTEGDHILGDLLRRGRRLGQSTPLLRVACCHLEAYEARRADVQARK